MSGLGRSVRGEHGVNPPPQPQNPPPPPREAAQARDAPPGDDPPGDDPPGDDPPGDDPPGDDPPLPAEPLNLGEATGWALLWLRRRLLVAVMNLIEAADRALSLLRRRLLVAVMNFSEATSWAFFWLRTLLVAVMDLSGAAGGAPLWLRTLLVACFFLPPLFLATGVCPAASEVSAAALPEYVYQIETVMFSDALVLLEYYQREAARAGPAAMAVAGRESDRIAGRAANLSRGISEMREEVSRISIPMSLEVAALKTRISRARDEARDFEGAKRLWLYRLACLPCGFIPGTLPYPIHPVAIARRELEALKNILALDLDAYSDLLKQHKNTETKYLQAANDDVCQASKNLHSVDSNRGPSQQEIPRLQDLAATAFGVCQLIGQEMKRGEQYRQQKLSGIMDFVRGWREEAADIGSRLDRAEASLSWSPEHIEVGMVAMVAIDDLQ